MKLTAQRLLPFLLLALPLGAQRPATKPAPDPEKAAPAKRLLLESLKQLGVEVDMEKQTVSIPAWVNDPPPPDPIEYLLVHRKGKRHEAIFVTDVKAGLL